MDNYIVKSEFVLKEHQDRSALEVDGYVIKGNIGMALNLEILSPLLTP
jgi:hypothetical protein